ncbi:MAG: antitoxin VapB family protein [Candidatus Woesearchaeota archaeon]
MATKSITITDKAFDFLKAIKGDRSYSDTILELSKFNSEIMRFAGIFEKKDLSDVRNAREKINQDWNNRH